MIARRISTVGAALIAAMYMSCSAMLIPARGDPSRKLSQARLLIDEYGRPLPAENLIVEAIGLYEGTGDKDGLANAYRTYGLFFMSRSIARWHEHYSKRGFIDSSASYEQRFQRALHWLEKAVPFT